MTNRTIFLNHSSSSFLSWRRVGRAFSVFVILALATLPIIGTYLVFSHTADEPAHIAAGMESLDRGTFTYEQQHPPLARLAVAVGPYLLGARSHGASYLGDEGLAILYTSGDYVRTLRAARLGVLPFFVALVAITWVWAHREFGTLAGAAAALIARWSRYDRCASHVGVLFSIVRVCAMARVSKYMAERYGGRHNGARNYG
jgi:hypothetical protein